MYGILKGRRLHNLNILKCQFELFDTVVKPILLYMCEVLGMGITSVTAHVIAHVRLKFCNILRNLNKSTLDFEFDKFLLDIIYQITNY